MHNLQVMNNLYQKNDLKIEITKKIPQINYCL